MDIVVYAAGTNVTNRRLAELDDAGWRTTVDTNKKKSRYAVAAVHARTATNVAVRRLVPRNISPTVACDPRYATEPLACPSQTF